MRPRSVMSVICGVQVRTSPLATRRWKSYSWPACTIGPEPPSWSSSRSRAAPRITVKQAAKMCGATAGVAPGSGRGKPVAAAYSSILARLTS